MLLIDCASSVLWGIPYQCSCTMRKTVISYGSTLYHAEGHAIVGSMRALFTSIHSV